MPIHGRGRFSFGLLMLCAALAPSGWAAPKKGQPPPPPPAVEAPAEPKPAPPVEPPADVPVMAPFTGPASNRPMPNPAPMPDSSLGESSLEGDLTSKLIEYQADVMVSSASKREQRLKDVPLSISWIPAEELEGTGQFTLCDAIQYFPGMECRRGAMRKAAVSAQGLGSNFLSNRLLLLKNGRPETDPWTGIFYPDETTPLTNVKQIEVIKGPGSSLYGSNAFSGVINVIQRAPEDLMKDGRDYGADIRFLGGQDNTYRLQTSAAGRLGPVTAMANYYGLYSDGPQLLNNPALNVVDSQEWSRINQVSGRVTVKALTLDVEYTKSHIGRPGGLQIQAVGNCGRCHYTPNDSEAVENLNSSIQADVKVNDWLRVFGEAYAFFKRREVQLENQVTHELQPSLGKRRRIGGEARALLDFGAATVTIGGDVKRDTINNQNVLQGVSSFETQGTIVGGFVDGEVRPLSNLVIGAGARYDYYRIPETIWRNQSSQVSPRASIVYHALPQLTLRTNYGRAFRAPTFAELAINQQMYAATLLGNPFLEAETLDTIEAAVDFWPLGGSVRASATGFYKHASNFINQEFLYGSTSQFQNIGDGQVVGLEAELAAKVPKLNSSFDIAYQFLNARALRAGTSTALDYAPSHRVYLRGHTNIGKVAFADIYSVYVGDRQDPAQTVQPDGTYGDHIVLPGYFVANGRLGAHVYEGLSISVLVQNMFNAKYQEMNGFPAPGLSVFSEVKFVY
jgi:hemoglobin/transferrin/lactoferrin receptor protein